ncbi:MAG: ribosome maturation factor RimP [Sulfurovaceae bacterium]|nr:ribosome maturation factor RimP [Sulfurovaceae bacterium]
MSLNEQIAKIVKANGANFYGTETAQEDSNTIYRVFITKEGGVKLDLCADISHELSVFFDVNPPMHGAYFLEVSSPGIERKLESATHFMSAIGERVKFKINGGDKEKGLIGTADEKGFTITLKGEDVRFEYCNISKAKTYYEWNKTK